MQPPGPPRPFRGAQYDKDMFTFLPARFNRDVLDESPKKRKLTSSDHQITDPAPNVRQGISGASDSKLNDGSTQRKEFQNSTPSSGPRKSSKGYSDHSKYWDQNDYAEKWHRNKRGFHESGSENTGYTSFSGPLQSPNHKVSSPLFPLPEARTHKTSNLAPSATENFNQHDNYESNLHVATHNEPNWPPKVTEDFSRCEKHRSKAHVTTHIALDWQPPLVQDSYRRETRESNAIVVTQNTSNWAPSMARDLPQHGNYEPIAHVAAHERSNGIPPEAQDLKHHENCDANAHVVRVAQFPHPQESRSYAHQRPVQPRAMASNCYEQGPKILGESQRLQQNVFEPGPVIGGLDEKCREETYKIDCPSNVKAQGDAGGFAGFDSAETYKDRSFSNVKQSDTDSFTAFDSNKAPGNNVSTSVYNLQSETNNLLNVLKLLSAASGAGLADNNNDGNAQGSGHDVKMMKSPPGAIVQNLNHPPAVTNLSKNHEDGLILNNTSANGEKGYAKLDNECKSENGPSAFAEKLWDGTLQLSTSVSASVIAFFKSGEKMLDFSWSESVEVRGKVRLEAFEKYVQDLPRSRSRGLMVMSFCWKEGSSDAGHKGMKEVARKYKEGKRVGFAKLSTDIDLYICPHSDAIITILAKHGFFKGMTAVKDKSELLIGCAVWKKYSSFAPAKKTAEVNAPQLGQNPMEAAKSDIGQAPTEGVQSGRIDKSPELFPSPQVEHAKQSMVTQNNLTSGSGASSLLSEIKTDVVLHKPILPIPSVSSKQSADFSDDDDLPEYDFRAAVSQASVTNTSAVATPISAAMKSEGSTAASIPVPNSNFQQCVEQYSEAQKPSFPTQEQNQIGHFQGPASQNTGQQHFHFQGLVPQSGKQYSEAHQPSFPRQDQNLSGHFQGPGTQNLDEQSLVKVSSLPTQEQKKIENSSKPRNLFDDDDMPEWCPPDFFKSREEATTKAEALLSSKVSGIANLTSPPPPPPPPPLTQMLHPSKPVANENPAGTSSQMQFKERDYACTHHHVPPPPPPPVGNHPSTNNFMHHNNNNPAAMSSQMQLNEREYCSFPNVPPPPPPTNNFMQHSPASTRVQFGDNNPAVFSSQMQFNEREYRSVPPAPPPPPPPPPPVGNHSSAAMQFGDRKPAAISSQMQFNEREYHFAPHMPPPPPPANLMHHSQMQFGDTNPASIPSQMHVPPPPVNTDNFMPHNPAARSTQMQFGDTNYSNAPHPPTSYTDNPMSDRVIHQNPAYPPGFTPNPAFRPCFDQPVCPTRSTRP
ncbi:uncharacterized protein [Spinacia oleracea]|uniref:Spen paralogue and orthologue SPOC C-terminal domain-containing protein n=1 Tax=Spinacia oleracea TaxID=3562 RepID=A0A9R0HSY6_SPIOL|nr:uncharacterized protein LOC110776196 [Spinacia oleracea]